MESQSESLSGAPFFVNYLTSPDLLELQLDEESFRRQILLQAQILVDFLLSPIPAKSRPTFDAAQVNFHEVQLQSMMYADCPYL